MLDEECAEFHKDKNVEELADIMEVVYALAKILSYFCPKFTLGLTATPERTDGADLL